MSMASCVKRTLSLKMRPFQHHSTNPLVLAMCLQKPDHFEVTADVPGFNKDEVSVDVHHGVLRIHAEKSERKESDEPGKDGVKWHRVERSSSTLSRQFKLPPAADEARISAKAENGVLSVTIPKLEAAAAGAKKVAVA